MRYIRTKRGHIVDTKDMHPETLKWYQEFHLLKQSESIDELCDLFMANKGYKMFYARENGFRTLDDIRLNCGLENCKSLYAYIYGEDGDIIKVAKMNEKGVLELL